MIGRLEGHDMSHFVPQSRTPVKTTRRPPRGAVHRDKVAEGHPEQAHAGHAHRANGEVVVVRVEFDDHGPFGLELILCGERFQASLGQFNDIGPQNFRLFFMEPDDDLRPVNRHRQLIGIVRKELVEIRISLEVLETIQQPQRVDGLGAERVPAVGQFEMARGLIVLSFPHQIDGQVGVGGPQLPVCFDRLEIEISGLPIAPCDHIEMSWIGVDAPVSGVALQRLRHPFALGRATQEVDRGFQGIGFEGGDVLFLGFFEGFIEALVGLLEVVLFDIHRCFEDIGFIQLRVCVEHLGHELAGLAFESPREDAGLTQLGGSVVFVKFEGLVEQLRRLTGVVRFEEEVSPAHPNVRVFRLGLERLAKHLVGLLKVPQAPESFGLGRGTRIGVNQLQIAAAGLDSSSVVPVLVAGPQVGAARAPAWPLLSGGSADSEGGGKQGDPAAPGPCRKETATGGSESAVLGLAGHSFRPHAALAAVG